MFDPIGDDAERDMWEELHKLGWKPVIIDSSFKATDTSTNEEHRAYLERAIKDCILRLETPYASHKMLVDALDDNDPGQRRICMNAGLAMSSFLVRTAGAKPVFYVDYGWTEGMRRAQVLYERLGVKCDLRTIGKGKGVLFDDKKGTES